MQKLTQWFSDFRAGRLSVGSLFTTAKKEALNKPSTQRDFFVEPIHQRAVGGLKYPGSWSEVWFLRQQGMADWQNVHPDVKLFAAKFIEAARQRQIPLYVHSAFRTKAQQTEVWSRGASKTQWPRAAHCQGKAVDIVHSVKHWDMSIAEWAFLQWLGADTIRKINAERPKEKWLHMVWGGDWDGDGDIHDQRLYDPAHWEIASWRDDIKKLPEGEPQRFTARGLFSRV